MKQKRPLVLFGIGKAFAYVSKQEVLADLFPEHGVVAIADNNPAAERKIFRVGSDEIRVAKNSSAFWRDLHHAYPAGADVFITSTKYQREIKEELTGAGIPASSILDHEKVMSAYYKRVFGGDAMQGRGIEIGGPTRMFQGIYAKCSSCDNVNFASDNMWNRNAPPRVHICVSENHHQRGDRFAGHRKRHVRLPAFLA